MNILALDLATSTGWASHVNDGVFESGVQRFDLQRGESPGMRYLRMDAWLAELLNLVKPRLVVYESAYLMPTAHASEIHYGMSTRVQAACASFGIDHMSINAMKLKKWAAGYGRASKAAMLDAACKKGWIAAEAGWGLPSLCAHACPVVKCVDPIHDRVDAIALLRYAIAELKTSMC
jgi:hypothetical protein